MKLVYSDIRKFRLPIIVIALLLSTIFCYFYFDKPIAEWVYFHNCAQHLSTLTSIIEWPIYIALIAPGLLLISLVLKPGKVKQTLILIGFSLLLTVAFRDVLKLIFNRYWPMTWINGNLSWIHDHVYGFQWFSCSLFQKQAVCSSFPSGHTAIAFAAFLPIGYSYPRLLPYSIILASLEGLVMVAFNYHFLSDVLAGAMVGIICFSIVASFLNQPQYLCKKIINS